MKRLKKRPVPARKDTKPAPSPHLLMWCHIGNHAGLYDSAVMLCPGKPDANTILCACECHDDPVMQDAAREKMQLVLDQVVSTQKVAEPAPEPKALKKKKLRRVKL